MTQSAFSSDFSFKSQLDKLLDSKYMDVHLTSDAISHALYISRATLYRKIKQLKGVSFIDYIQEMRLQKAFAMLQSNPKPLVKQVARAVGFIKVSYFSRKFYERFGILPSQI